MKRKIVDTKTGRIRIISDNHVNKHGEETASLTQQHHKDAHDINLIMKKYQKIGVGYNQLPPSQKGVYGDFSNVKTYQQAAQSLIDAQNSFMTLPSSVRKRFHNNPNELFEFLNDKTKRAEAIELGLIPAPSPSPEPTPAEAPPSTFQK